MPNFSIRPATEQDIPTLLGLIRGLAEYEKRPEVATATEEDLRLWLFGRGVAEALIAEADGQAAGYAVFYPIFSTFRGSASLYLEDLFLLPAHRGQGCGKALFGQVAAIALQRGFHGLHWSCLKNNHPGRRFYAALGAQRLTGSMDFALEGEPMCALAKAGEARQVRP